MSRSAGPGKTHLAREVARENRLAAQAELPAHDPRWVLAARTQAQLQGTVLSPQRRDGLMRIAQTMGMRPFDANMVIALVQEQARSGGRLEETAAMLSLVREPVPSRSPGWIRWVAVAAGAAALFLLLVNWLLGG